MIFDNVCYRCKYRLPDDHPEHEKAKAFWWEHHAVYIYACGAFYRPLSSGNPVEFHKGRFCDLDRELFANMKIV